SVDTIGQIHDELYRRALGGPWPTVVLLPATEVISGTARPGQVELTLEHRQQLASQSLLTDAVVLATGYAERPAEDLLRDIAPHLRRDRSDRLVVDSEYRLVTSQAIPGSVFVQNAVLHTHGVGAPDLG